MDHPALAGNRDIHKAVCQIAQIAAEPEVEVSVRAWRDSQSALLKTTKTEVNFFGGQAVARLSDSEGLRVELRNAHGEVKTVDPEKMPLTLGPLKRRLQGAAIDRISEIRYTAIQQKAGLTLAQVHQALQITRDDDSKKLAAKAAGDLNGLLNQAVTAIRQLLAPDEMEMAKAIVPGAHTPATYNLIHANRAIFRQLEKEAPQLLPLLGQAIAEKAVTGIGLDAYKQLKEKFRAAGYGDGVWKFLVKLPAPTIEWLARAYPLRQVIPIVGSWQRPGWCRRKPFCRPGLRARSTAIISCRRHGFAAPPQPMHKRWAVNARSGNLSMLTMRMPHAG